LWLQGCQGSSHWNMNHTVRTRLHYPVFFDVKNTSNPSITFATFKSNFAFAMIKMSKKIEPLTSSARQIRRIYSVVYKLKMLFCKHLGVLYVVLTFLWFVIFGFLILFLVLLISLELFNSRTINLHLLYLVCVVYITFCCSFLLCYALFSGLSWNIVQNTWLTPKNASRAIWSFLEFKVDPEKMNNRLRQIDRSIISSEKKSINRIISRRNSIDYLCSHEVDRSNLDISKKIFRCRHNFVRMKLFRFVRSLRDVVIHFEWPKLILDGHFFCKSKFLYIWNAG
jgi:hypothetical protein